MSREAQAVARFLSRAGRRRATALTLSGAGVAVAGALVLLAAGWLGWLPFGMALAAGLVCVVAGAVEGGRRARRARARIAHEVERRAPQCLNLLVTAAELIGAPESGAPLARRTKPEIVRLVESRAAQLVARLDPSSLFPLRHAALTLVVALALWASLAAGALARPLAVDAPPRAAPIAAITAASAIDRIEVLVTPPQYTGRAARTLVDPARLTVLAGAQIDLHVYAGAASVELSTLAASRDLVRRPDGSFATAIVATADGFLALEPRDAEGAPGARRLIGLVVTPDAPPLVRITEPGRDRFFPDADHTIPLAFSAQDDFGLDSLRLTYTIVSGSGEIFEFTEGELPAPITRADQRSWSATANLSLADLGLALGDMVVYRAVASDQRPGAVEVDSDSFVVEIVGKDAAIAGGFALESDEERHALSQRMVIVKTERLLAQKASMPSEDYDYEARRLAAEQRAVRAEFIFMMGGEVQDEVEEAAHEHEIAAGRLELRGRREMRRSVLYMSQAAAQLGNVDLEAALPLELTALEALQSALARSRYILRVLSARESIDLTRRLTGDAGVVRGRRAGELADVDAELVGLRRVLADAASLVALPSFDRQAGRQLSELAETVVRLDPSADALQAVAAELDAAATLVAGGNHEAARTRIIGVIEELTARVQARLPVAPQGAAGNPRLAGALIDALDRGGRQ